MAVKTPVERKYIEAYSRHGIEFVSERKHERIAECPFCGKEHHFYVSSLSGCYECKKCGEKGNLQGFLHRIIKGSLQVTTEEEYEWLSRNRSIPVEALKAFQVCKSYVSGEWLIPTFSDKGLLRNVHRWVWNKSLWATDECKQELFGLDKFNESAETIWLCEGHWDGIVLSYSSQVVTLKGKGKMSDSHTVLAVPGATTFFEDWTKQFIGKRVILCYDNDDAGRKGIEKVLDRFAESEYKPSQVDQVVWKADDPNDVRDLFIKLRCKPASLVKELTSRVEKAATFKPTESVIASPCDTFEELNECFSEHLHFSTAMKSTLATMLAVSISTNMEGDPIWLYVIGPPSSGKSTLAECLSANRRYVRPLSKFSGLTSGYKGQNGKDSSLIPKIQGKTVVIKDGTAMFDLEGSKQKDIMGTLRDVYDGETRSFYLNNVDRSYEGIRTTFIVCTTDKVRSKNNSELGERFLQIEIIDEETNADFILEKALDNTLAKLSRSFSQGGNSSRIHTPTQVVNNNNGHVNGERNGQTSRIPNGMLNLEILKAKTAGYINSIHRLLPTSPIPKIDSKTLSYIKSLAKLCSLCRARVSRDHQHHITHRQRPEMPVRLASQLTRLAICLAVVLNRPSVDEDCIAIIEKVVSDTSKGFILDLLLGIYQGDDTTTKLHKAVRLSKSKIDYLLEDMSELGIVTKSAKFDGRGRGYRYSLSPEIQSLCESLFK